MNDIIYENINDAGATEALLRHFESPAPPTKEQVKQDYYLYFDQWIGTGDWFDFKYNLPLQLREKLDSIYDMRQMVGPVGLAMVPKKDGTEEFTAIEAGIYYSSCRDFSDIVDRFDPKEYRLYFYDFIIDDKFAINANNDEEMLPFPDKVGIRGNFVKK